MTRRQLVSKFGVWAALFISFDLPLIGKRSHYRVVILNKTNSEFKFSGNDTSKFWQDHDDEFASALNSEFMASGKLYGIQTFMSKDLDAVYLIKYYRSKDDHEEYVHCLSAFHEKNGFHPKANSRIIT